MSVRTTTHPYLCSPTCRECEREEARVDLCDRLECDDPIWVTYRDRESWVPCGRCDRCHW